MCCRSSVGPSNWYSAGNSTLVFLFENGTKDKHGAAANCSYSSVVVWIWFLSWKKSWCAFMSQNVRYRRGDVFTNLLITPSLKINDCKFFPLWTQPADGIHSHVSLPVTVQDLLIQHTLIHSFVGDHWNELAWDKLQSAFCRPAVMLFMVSKQNVLKGQKAGECFPARQKSDTFLKGYVKKKGSVLVLRSGSQQAVMMCCGSGWPFTGGHALSCYYVISTIAAAPPSCH